MDPTPEITPTRAQLSVLIAILAGGTWYVDLALWGAYQNRAAKSMRCEGMVPGPDGTQVKADFRGPADFYSWHRCFLVCLVVMVMLDACMPPWLQAYVELVKEYYDLYGHRIWAFLYQQDVRFRSEWLPYMLMMESNR